MVPVTILKGDIFTTTEACDGLCAGSALLGIEVPKALDAVGVVILGGELLASQGGHAACADKTLLVPRLVPVGHSSLGQGLFAASAARSKLALVTGDTVIILLVWDEGS